jgi:tryptophan synthase beta chain
MGRIAFHAAGDLDAMAAFQLLARLEGILPALEPAHALHHVGRIAPAMTQDQIIIANLCGRGDKDIFAVAERLGQEIK